jgi:cell wall-associated NlpC family hydrolase
MSLQLDKAMDTVEILDMCDYAEKFIGTAYTWGGSSADEGFDCSGYIQEVLSSKGRDYRGDQTAQAMYKLMVADERYTSNEILAGTVLFYGRSVFEITHIALAVDTEEMIEAGGEGSRATRLGMVRKRPINNRSDLVAAIHLGE